MGQGGREAVVCDRIKPIRYKPPRASIPQNSPRAFSQCPWPQAPIKRFRVIRIAVDT